MKFFETSKYFSLKKSTYINLRWISVIGQFITVNTVYFILSFQFDFLYLNLVIIFGILSNLYLIYFNNKTQLSERTALVFLLIDIFQLSFLIFLTGGITNPFIIFLIIPSIFASSNLGFKTNLLLVIVSIILIIILTFFYSPLPYPLDNEFVLNPYIYYAIPISLIIALVFLNYFAITFGIQSRLRKEALNKMQEVMAKEHELLSLGGQAAAAAHSLGTPLSTIKIITQELMQQFKDKKEILKDIELLSSQVERCNQILKRLSINPTIEDDFIDKDLAISDYINEIVKSFKEISQKEFIVNVDQFLNSIKITKSIEIVYGLRNFIGNANKFARGKIFITLKSDGYMTEVNIEDDGEGYPKDILSKIGEPYLKTLKSPEKSKLGLGLGIFIGKTLLEKNYAKIQCRNSKTRSGAEIIINWKNKDLLSI